LKLAGPGIGEERKDFSRSVLLARVTFSELISLAQAAGLLVKSGSDALKKIVDVRNDVAHLRGPSFEEGRVAAEHIESFVGELSTSLSAAKELLDPHKQ
jgi:hypothetical protein